MRQPGRPARLIPRDRPQLTVAIDGRQVALTNLDKPFWPALGLTKGDLLEYYAEMAEVLLPHLRDRAMVMKRYPNGAAGPFFFMKRAPSPRPSWVRTCRIEHGAGNAIDFPIIDDLAALLWVVNLGCIDLNPWYARCDDVTRPDYLHFDLDPGQSPFAQVIEAAFAIRGALQALDIPVLVKTSGSKGLHLYVPIVRGPTQHQVWRFAKAFATELARRNPRLLTAVYAVARRPADRVHVDFNQNAFARTLASVYSVRPTPWASVSTPLTWDELARGPAMRDFRIDNVPARVRAKGDLFAPLLAEAGRFPLGKVLATPELREYLR